jgi:hypothetical protein
VTVRASSSPGSRASGPPAYALSTINYESFIPSTFELASRALSGGFNLLRSSFHSSY